jgi:hypothetical protein
LLFYALAHLLRKRIIKRRIKNVIRSVMKSLKAIATFFIASSTQNYFSVNVLMHIKNYANDKSKASKAPRSTTRFIG